MCREIFVLLLQVLQLALLPHLGRGHVLPAVDGVDCTAGAKGHSLECAVRTLLPLWREQGLASTARDHSFRDSEPYTDMPESTGVNLRGCSAVGNVCAALTSEEDRTRLGCLQDNVAVLYNARVSLQKVELFRGAVAGAAGNASLGQIPSSSDAGACPLHQSRAVPKLFSLKSYIYNQKTMPRTPPITLHNGSFSEVCPDSDTIKGTLHIQAPWVTGNLFHLMNDNLMGLFALVALDASTAPQWVAQPRALLWAHDSQSIGALPHIQWLLDATQAFYSTTPAPRASAAERESGSHYKHKRCFRRVIWGANHPKLFFEHSLVSLRRMAAQLLREFLRREYQPVLPPAFRATATATTTTATATTTTTNGAVSKVVKSSALTRRVASTGITRPLRIAFYSREKIGGLKKSPKEKKSKGRRLLGDGRIVSALRAAGANVQVHSPGAEYSLQQQLELAFYADVVIGLHGAGLTNALVAPPGVILVELKTAFAYHLDTMVLVADATRGVYAHVDLLDFGMKDIRVDDALIGRVSAALQAADAQHKLAPTNATRLQSVDNAAGAADVFMSVAGSHSIDAHPLGPMQSRIVEECEKLDFSQYWKKVGTNNIRCKARSGKNSMD